MNQPHIFWGSRSPLASLCGGALLIIASARLAYALIVAGALLWVYGFSVLAVYPGSRLFPSRGKPLILIFLSSFIGSVYLLALWFTSPLTALEVFFPVSLVPLFCAGSGIFKRTESLALDEALGRAFSEAAVFGGLLILFALIREPLGFYTLSLPGSSRGITPLFVFEEGFLPIRLVASSAGALLLLGYGVGLYRYFRKIHAPREDEL
jgi:hypothetical protein